MDPSEVIPPPGIETPTTPAMPSVNVSATLNVFRTIKDPSLLCPHQTIATFAHLPIPLSSALRTASGREPDIRAVVLDKDNCFARPHAQTVYAPYNDVFTRLKAAYPGDRLLIVSNSAGTASDDADGAEAAALERNTGVRVFRHGTKKPGCWPDVLEFLRSSPDAKVTSPDQVVVVGDRLSTDVLMANLMGSWAVWVSDGVVPAGGSFFGGIEQRLAEMLRRRQWAPPTPSGRKL